MDDKPKKNILLRSFNYATLLMFLIILGAIIFSLIYFLEIKDRNKFPMLQSTVNSDKLVQDGFKESSYFDRISIFVPNSWIITDSEKKAYSDIFNGSSAYIVSTINNLGVLNDEVCTNFSRENQEKLSRVSTYQELKSDSFYIKEFNGLNGCYAEYSAKVGKENFKIKTFTMFTKYQIYQVLVQYQNDLASQGQISELILNNIEFR